MIRIVLISLFCVLSQSAAAQRIIKMRNLWAKPQVHVLFANYTISFKIKDIDKALYLLAEIGDTSYGLPSRLDTAGDYTVELYPGMAMQYRNMLQRMLHEGIGAFLILSGHAEITGRHHRKVKEVEADIQPLGEVDQAYVLFYDPRTHRPLFSGSMPAGLYKKDLGID